MERINNFIFSGKYCGLKKDGSLDLGLMMSAVPLRVSAVFTRNKIKAAPVVISRKNSGNIIKALIVNSGNANACNGKYGISDARKVIGSLSKETGINKDNIFICSTGVIGERLNVPAIEGAVPELAESADAAGFDDFARAIMTTDTFSKKVSSEVVLDGAKYKIIGAAKGSGMIMPNMATMLAFLFTDMPLGKEAADSIFKECVEKSFNSITVDGDTSTNDTAALFYPAPEYADGKHLPAKPGPAFKAAKKAVLDACLSLAGMIVRDGEGATKFIKITVVNAYTEKDAKKAGLTVANSPLFKTMITGEDLNWGRIMAAVGRSSVRMRPDNIDIYINGKPVVENSVVSEKLDKTMEKTILTPAEIHFKIDLKSGKSEWTVLTCNLTKEYIDINASYRS